MIIEVARGVQRIRVSKPSSMIVILVVEPVVMHLLEISVCPASSPDLSDLFCRRSDVHLGKFFPLLICQHPSNAPGIFIRDPFHAFDMVSAPDWRVGREASLVDRWKTRHTTVTRSPVHSSPGIARRLHVQFVVELCIKKCSLEGLGAKDSLAGVPDGLLEALLDLDSVCHVLLDPLGWADTTAFISIGHDLGD